MGSQRLLGVCERECGRVRNRVSQATEATECTHCRSTRGSVLGDSVQIKMLRRLGQTVGKRLLPADAFAVR